jgi:hypothetical protein
MRRAIAALIVGLALGYHWGYGDGNGGQPSIASRVLDRFGTSKVRAAQEAHEQRIQEASRP